MTTIFGTGIISHRAYLLGDRMPIDRLFIESKLDASKRYVGRLNALLNESEEIFLEDFDLQLKGERIFEVLAKLMLDICTHIVANSDAESPQSYADCMRALAKLGIFDEQTATKFVALVKMRNLIVHQYGSIDYHVLFRSLKTLNEDFSRFQTEILGWLQKQIN